MTHFMASIAGFWPDQHWTTRPRTTRTDAPFKKQDEPQCEGSTLRCLLSMQSKAVGHCVAREALVGSRRRWPGLPTDCLPHATSSMLFVIYWVVMLLNREGMSTTLLEHSKEGLARCQSEETRSRVAVAIPVR